MRRTRSGRILAFGGANVDWTCRVHDPARLGTSNPGTIERSFGGVARNVACTLGRLGVPVGLVSIVGRDAGGTELVADCERQGVDCRRVVRADAPTGSYVATLDADGDLLVGVADMAALERLTPAAIEACEAAVAAAEMVFAEANLPAASLVALARIAARHAVPLVLDPVSTPKAPRVLAVVEAGLPVALLTPNRDEIAALTQRPIGTPAELEPAAAALRGRGVERLLVGLGAAGVLVVTAEGCRLVPGRAAAVVDVTGAGDASIGAVLWALCAGEDLLTAARAGQIAAAVTVASPGAVSPALTAEVLRARLAEGDPA